MKKIKITPVIHPNLLSSYWLKEWKVMVGVVFFGLIFNGALPLISIKQGYLVDEFTKGVPFTQLLSAFLSFFFVVLFLQIARALKRYYVRLFANKTVASMRLLIYHKMLRLDIKSSLKEATGDWMNKAVSDVELCVEGMRKATTETFDTGVLMISYILTLLYYDVTITIIACFFILIAMFFAQHLKQTIVKYTKAARLCSSQLTTSTYELIDHALLFKLRGLQVNQREPYLGLLHEYASLSFKADLMQNALYPLYNALAMFGIVALFIIGGRYVIDGWWSIGTFTAYTLIFTALAIKASKAAKLFNSFQMASVSWQRIKPYFDEYESFNQPQLPQYENVHIQLKQVDFAYGDEPILKNVSFEAKQGDFIGICGQIASGKSTLAQGLLNLVPYQGQILLNNLELSSYSIEELSTLIAYCPHQPQLMTDSISNNIALGGTHPIDQVVHEVFLDLDIELMSEGVQTLLSHRGSSISGGQQSRIALARALYTNCPILILDDSCSSVDQETELKIIENLRNSYSNRIIFYITHRVQNLKLMDKVLIINHDSTTSYATHDELIKDNQDYQQLFQKGCRIHE